mgnify:CR=1 FL=1
MTHRFRRNAPIAQSLHLCVTFPSNSFIFPRTSSASFFAAKNAASAASTSFSLSFCAFCANSNDANTVAASFSINSNCVFAAKIACSESSMPLLNFPLSSSHETIAFFAARSFTFVALISF